MQLPKHSVSEPTKIDKRTQAPEMTRIENENNQEVIEIIDVDAFVEHQRPICFVFVLSFLFECILRKL